MSAVEQEFREELKRLGLTVGPGSFGILLAGYVQIRLEIEIVRAFPLSRGPGDEFPNSWAAHTLGMTQ